MFLVHLFSLGALFLCVCVCVCVCGGGLTLGLCFNDTFMCFTLEKDIVTVPTELSLSRDAERTLPL